MSIIRCSNCRRLRTVTSYPFTCRCGKVIEFGDAIDLSDQYQQDLKLTVIDTFININCKNCPKVPCLAEKLCQHRDALLLGATCPEGRPFSKVRWISSQQRIKDILNLIPKIPPTVTAVAGVPRSGLTPASMIAEVLQLPLYSIHPQTGLQLLPTGYRLREYTDNGDLLVIDDTVATGHSMEEVLPHLPKNRKSIVSTIYLNPFKQKLVDIYSIVLPLPHYLEWNFFNSVYTERAAFDMDGVIVDEEHPQRGIKFCPRRYPIKAIITGRMASTRELTQDWLHKNKFKVEQLYMWPGRDEERWINGACAIWKGETLRKVECNIFVESCPVQSKIIAEVSGKRVICPTSGEVYN